MKGLLNQYLAGLPWQWWAAILFFGLSLLTLLFSMIVASRWAGGIEFGHIGQILPRAGLLLLLVTAVNFLTCGVLLAGPIWLFGLMYLFQLDFREARILTRINWGMNLVWRLLLFLAML